MNPQRWRQVEEIYHSALEQSPQTRAAFVADACRGDGDLLQKVQSLLAAVERLPALNHLFYDDLAQQVPCPVYCVNF
jgi:hypothetical protein